MSNENSVNKLVLTKKPSLKKLDDMKKKSTVALNSVSLDTSEMAVQLEKYSISSKAAEIAEQIIKPLENSAVNAIISKNKLLLDKNPFLKQMENVTQKIDCSLNSISLNAVNTAALMKNCSIGPTASEVGAKIIEEMEKKSITASVVIVNYAPPRV